MTLLGPSACSQRAWGGVVAIHPGHLPLQCRGYGRKVGDNKTTSLSLCVQPFQEWYPGQPYSGMNRMTDWHRDKRKKGDRNNTHWMATQDEDQAGDGL